MKIPIARKVKCVLNKEKELTHISWFKWSSGMEFTYCVGRKESRGSNNIYTEKVFTEEDYADNLTINDKYLHLSDFKDFGIPLKGRGYVFGISFRKDGLYYDFIYETEYLAHIYVKVDATGKFDGRIIVPPTWNVDKRKRILLANHKDTNVESVA